MISLKETPQGVTFAVKVQPCARRNAVSGTAADALKLAVAAPPLEGRANQGVVEFLAEFFDIPRASVTITSGQRSRIKVVCISGMSAEQVRERLEAATKA